MANKYTGEVFIAEDGTFHKTLAMAERHELWTYLYKEIEEKDLTSPADILNWIQDEADNITSFIASGIQMNKEALF